MAIIHIVHFAFEPNTESAKKEEVATRFYKLKKSCRKQNDVEYILDITGGLNNSPEGKSEDLEHSYILKFSNLTDRDYYVQQDKAHHEFSKWARSNGVTRAIVMDFDEGAFKIPRTPRTPKSPQLAKSPELAKSPSLPQVMGQSQQQ